MKSITIISWPKQHLPVNWNGVAPEELQGQTEDLECDDLRDTRIKIAGVRMRMQQENKHYHIIEDGKIIFNSALIKS